MPTLSCIAPSKPKNAHISALATICSDDAVAVETVDNPTNYSTEDVAVSKVAGRGYGLFAQRKFKRGDVVLTETPLCSLAVDEAQAARDPVLAALDEDARTVLALAQLDSGR